MFGKSKKQKIREELLSEPDCVFGVRVFDTDQEDWKLKFTLLRGDMQIMQRIAALIYEAAPADDIEIEYEKQP